MAVAKEFNGAVQPFLKIVRIGVGPQLNRLGQADSVCGLALVLLEVKADEFFE